MKVVITLDSVLDTRKVLMKYLGLFKEEEYPKEIVLDEKVLEEYSKRDRSILFYEGLEETNINKLLIYLKAEYETDRVAMDTLSDFKVYINTYPYELSNQEMESLKQAFSMKMTYAKEVEVFYQEPSLLYLRSYNIFIDYSGLEMIDTCLSPLEKDKEALKKLPSLNDTVVIVPTILFHRQSYEEVKEQLKSEDLSPFFMQTMREYSILLSLEFVDSNFFKATK